jgi:hypothetical protein
MLLLELARDLLTRATNDDSQPIPVVFPLSTWAEKRKPLSEWLEDELNLRYDIPRAIAKEWVESDQVLPLLDGLDKVKAGNRVACVDAINAFRQSHGLLPLAITSRTADYEALADPLRLHWAILVRPLTRNQVTAYLADLGLAGEPVRLAVQEDPSLWELLDSPLLLNVISVTYATKPDAPAMECGTMADRRDHLFGSYVSQALKRRSVGPYKPEQTIRWLGWLADQMAKHSQTVFYLERLQEDWLPKSKVKLVQIGYFLALAVVGGVIGLVSARLTLSRLRTSIRIVVYMVSSAVCSLESASGSLNPQIKVSLSRNPFVGPGSAPWLWPYGS